MRILALHGRSGAAWYRMQMPPGELARRADCDVTFASAYSQASATGLAGYGEKWVMWQRAYEGAGG